LARVGLGTIDSAQARQSASCEGPVGSTSKVPATLDDAVVRIRAAHATYLAKLASADSGRVPKAASASDRFAPRALPAQQNV